ELRLAGLPAALLASSTRIFMAACIGYWLWRDQAGASWSLPTSPVSGVVPTARYAATTPDQPRLLKIALDLGPLIIFFAANATYGIVAASASFMVAIVLALGVSYGLTRRLPMMPLVTAIIVLVFGTLTLVLHDELFIKLKPTIIYVLFGGV